MRYIFRRYVLEHHTILVVEPEDSRPVDVAAEYGDIVRRDVIARFELGDEDKTGKGLREKISEILRGSKALNSFHLLIIVLPNGCRQDIQRMPNIYEGEAGDGGEMDLDHCEREMIEMDIYYVDWRVEETVAYGFDVNFVEQTIDILETCPEDEVEGGQRMVRKIRWMDVDKVYWKYMY